MTEQPEQPGPLETELLDIALQAAQRAGTFLLEQRPADLGVAATKSSSVDVVTEMDLASERLITGFLTEHRPEDGILGEEGASFEGTSGVRWVVDPIDGTVNYLYGLPAWAVSIAAQQGGETLVGVVVVPARDETFRAVHGQGAHLGDAPAALPHLPAARRGADRHRVQLRRAPPPAPGRGGPGADPAAA